MKNKLLFGALPLRLSLDEAAFPDAQITWELTATGGELYAEDAYRGSSMTVDNHTLIRWEVVDPDGTVFQGETAYINAVVRADGHIVGYAVIELQGEVSSVAQKYGGDDYDSYTPLLIACECYPMADGQYQDVTEEHVTNSLKK